MTVEEMIKNSQCFGIAYDARVPECRTCDVKAKCEAKSRSTWGSVELRPAPTIVAEVNEIVSKPEIESIEAKMKTSKPLPTPKIKKNPPVKPATSNKKYSEDMPEFKGYTIEQLEKMAVERGANLEDFEKFKAVNIRRMRLTMFLKKTYEV